MNDEFQKRRTELMEYLQDPSAVEFIELVFDITDTWDDLIDKDEEVNDEEINEIFTKCLVHLPGNVFYRNHYAVLAPQIMLAINAWMDANELEGGSPSDRIYACCLRFMLVQIITTSVAITRGQDVARKLSVEIWKKNTNDEDTISWIRKEAD